MREMFRTGCLCFTVIALVDNVTRRPKIKFSINPKPKDLTFVAGLPFSLSLSLFASALGLLQEVLSKPN